MTRSLVKQMTLTEPVVMPDAVLDAIARDARDLREVHRLVRRAVGVAVLEGRGCAENVAARAQRKQVMGFL